MENDELLARIAEINGCESVAMCPNCGFDHIHQRHIEVFSRSEDSEATSIVKISGHDTNKSIATVETSGDPMLNPSSRRQGLTIYFNCENCESNILLHVYQHKGQTFMKWEHYE